MFRRHAPLLVAITAGVTTGVYIWQPSFEQLKRMNNNQPITRADQLRPAPTYLPLQETEKNASNSQENEQTNSAAATTTTTTATTSETTTKDKQSS
ncbi:hypothetical protein BDF22DRAFT_744924 [Syncephalis plumigaleata]|nr:hypothetical protein BDF22DRAFT_744924 [Syncephalis plumigaleata]